jgi:hypothetical protein
MFEGRLIRLIRIWAMTGEWPREQFRYEMSFNWKRVAKTIGLAYLALAAVCVGWWLASTAGLV